MVAAPLLGLWTISLLEAGSSSVVSCFGQEIISVNVDKQSILFGYLFHLAAFIGGLYSFHLKDPWQISMGLLYAASAVGVAFAGDLLSLFLWWEALAVTSVFQIWGRKTERSEQAGFRYLFFHVLSGLLLLAASPFGTPQEMPIPLPSSLSPNSCRAATPEHSSFCWRSE